jgi:hypothetical protein
MPCGDWQSKNTGSNAIMNVAGLDIGITFTSAGELCSEVSRVVM